MKKQDTFTRFGFITLFLLLLLNISVREGFSALVDKDEAVAVADLWYAMELNSAHAKIDKAERAERFGKLQKRQVLYLVSKDDLLDSPPDNGEVLAYVVKYEPTGYVIVSGEDRIEPIVVFSVKSQFRWDQPKRNFLRYFLGTEMPERWECLKTQEAEGITINVHPNWLQLRSKRQQNIGLQEVSYEPAEGPVYAHWDTALWSQGGSYNEIVVANNGNTAGIPTGCAATAMAIKMRFHEWPPTGNGSHSYDDNDGDIKYSHSVNFGAHSYNWSAMPTGSLTSANLHVAYLMYHCGVAVEMDYEVGGSRAWPSASVMDSYFRYWGTWERTRTPHTMHVKKSVLGGLPVVLATTAHVVVADGYWDDSGSLYFHFNCGWNGSNNGWYSYSLDDIPGGDPTIDKSYPYSSPDNYVYVVNSSGASEYGTLAYPFDTLSEGITEVPDWGHLWVKQGRYSGSDNVPVTIDKPMSIRSYEGTAIIGENIQLSSTNEGVPLRDSPLIKIRSGGVLKIY